VRRFDENRIAVDGTPADCVRLALHHLLPNTTWILSGINAGGNLGTDIYHSGTVAAVREGVLNGVPGIAVSHYIARGRSIDWSRASEWTEEVLRLLLERPWQPGTYWNVNLPHPEPHAPAPEVCFCAPDPSPLPLVFHLEGDRALYAGDYQRRARQAGCDVEVCFGGRIAISLIQLLPASNPNSDGAGRAAIS
jgi:5'-nucleotidase